MSMFWFGSSISDFYKIIKDSHCSFDADSNQNNHLSGRHITDESGYKRSKNSQGYIDFSVAESRLCNKSAEICSGALAKDRVSRSVIYLNQDSIQELQWWFNNLEICNGRLIVSPTSKEVI